MQVEVVEQVQDLAELIQEVLVVLAEALLAHLQEPLRQLLLIQAEAEAEVGQITLYQVAVLEALV
jgi:hypothetical protein